MSGGTRIALLIVVTVCTPGGQAAPGYTVHPAAEYRAFHLRGTDGTDVLVSVGAGGFVEVLVFQLRQSRLAEYRTRGRSSSDRTKAQLQTPFHDSGALDPTSSDPWSVAIWRFPS